MWVKLCGNTSLADARLCASAGASALGFIFAAHSKRYIPPEQASAICHALALEFPQIERIGVFTDADAATIARIAEGCALTGVQLQSPQTQEEAATLRRLLPNARIIAAFPWAGADDFNRRLAANAASRSFDAFLVDHATGGTGQPFAWQDAAQSFAAAASSGLPVIAAGGLKADNVTEAIQILRPGGVDAVSSVESTPGAKDAALVRAFVLVAQSR